MPRRRSRGLAAYVQRTNLLTSLLLVFPLYLFYQVAVALVPGVGNGADVLTAALLALAGHSRTHYLLIHLALGVAFLVVVLVLRSRQEFQLRLFVPVIVESTLYALCMGSLILWGMQALGIPPTLAAAKAEPAAGPLGALVMSVGAGCHEELVFRLLLLPALFGLLGPLLGLPRWLAWALAFFVSAALFSAAHHVIGGEPWRVGVFVYRLGCGLFFAALFHFRGFAVAVYTHTLYDVWVMVLA